jgi:2-amino-4-hydroxy-6-hydroxymethyldihydropteridine diphosphokinase
VTEVAEAVSPVVRAYVGLGSNLNDPRAQLACAFAALAALRNTRLAARSGLYRSAALDGSAQPDYLNAVAALDTTLDAHALLAALHAIERAQGRERPLRWAARTLDLDLLLYGDEICDEPGLRLPHPELHRRSFVLLPLAELDAALVIPGLGGLQALIHRCPAHALQRVGDD